MADKKTATTLPFKIETGVALPPIARAGGGGQSSPYAVAMAALQPSADPKKLQSFLIPLPNVPDSMSAASDDEKNKWRKEQARKISNRVSGISRRMTKADATKAFAIRSGTDGVRVFRVTPEAKTTG